MQYLLFNVALSNAEGVDLIPIDSRAVEEAFVPLKRETARIGLTVNYVKTKYMIAGRDRGRGSVMLVCKVVTGEMLEVVEECVYLETLEIMKHETLSFWSSIEIHPRPTFLPRFRQL